MPFATNFGKELLVAAESPVSIGLEWRLLAVAKQVLSGFAMAVGVLGPVGGSPSLTLSLSARAQSVCF